MDLRLCGWRPGPVEVCAAPGEAEPGLNLVVMVAGKRLFLKIYLLSKVLACM